MKIFSLRMQMSVILLVWVISFIGCSSSEGDVPAVKKAIHQFAVKEGKRLFLHLCSPCHGESGTGDGIYWGSALNIAPADLTKLTAAQSSTIFKTVKYGSGAQNKSKLCPPWKNNISDEEIEYIVSYVETLHPK
ncbi:MAG: cytochrome c [Desulfobacterales bacterium]|nr:cytochrome c [Desulfobacterales bacterium]